MPELSGGNFGGWSIEDGASVATRYCPVMETTYTADVAVDGDDILITDDESTVWMYRLPDGSFVGIA